MIFRPCFLFFSNTRGWVCGFSWGKSLLNEEYFSWYIFNIELKKSSGVLTGPLLNIFMKTSIPNEWDTPWNVGKKSHPSRAKAFNIDLAKVGIIDSSFKSFWHLKPFQVFSCPPCLFLKFRRRWTYLMELEMVSDGREHSSENLRKFHQDLTSGTMSRLHLSSKSLPRISEDMDLEMLLGKEHPSKVSVKTSSSDIRNHLSSKSLPGV